MPRITATTDQHNVPGATNAGAADTDETVIRDVRQPGRHSFEQIRAELQRAFAASDAGYTPLTAAEVIARNEH
ncbi:hypothetical protein SAMN05428997_11717 [Bosea sp. CRIB-10]|uniref:hypothetical protein n=1 Tax=Bosea sp. CRIB-10 TaxID=378404 RepID=UPI0008E14457|nr:hypothetical protein [Bosea sp. CRIB-10]SFD07537.1 hypothetical protein SAMN05428997_11717 [Bosea sp. CRIB-10]